MICRRSTVGTSAISQRSPANQLRLVGTCDKINVSRTVKRTAGSELSRRERSETAAGSRGSRGRKLDRRFSACSPPIRRRMKCGAGQRRIIRESEIDRREEHQRKQNDDGDQGLGLQEDVHQATIFFQAGRRVRASRPSLGRTPGSGGIVRKITRRDRLPNVEYRRHDLPACLDHIGPLKERRVADHAVEKQAFVAGAELFAESDRRN